MSDSYRSAEEDYFGDYQNYGYGQQLNPSPTPITEVVEEVELAPINKNLFSYKADETEGSNQTWNRKNLTPEENSEPLLPIKKALRWFFTGVPGVLLLLSIIVVSVVLFIWPGVFRAKQLEKTQTENEIKQIISHTFGWSVIAKVDCNVKNVVVKKGNSFKCKVFVDDCPEYIPPTASTNPDGQPETAPSNTPQEPICKPLSAGNADVYNRTSIIITAIFIDNQGKFQIQKPVFNS